MGKKTRKTRWRTLSISGACSEESDSCAAHADEVDSSERWSRGNAWGGAGAARSKYTPRTAQHRPQQSNDTAQQNGQTNGKITFNEDEYTRITTPRQDVLFKKGYLSRPRVNIQSAVQSQSSPAPPRSTPSSTPDHHSADGTESGESCEYDSGHLVYPYVDVNGVCYMNGVPAGFEPFPGFLVYPAAGPVCYPPPFTRRRPHDSADTPPIYAPHPYPYLCHDDGYYHQPQEVEDDNVHSCDPRRLKKKRRRHKISRSKPPNEATTDGYTDEEYSSDDGVSQSGDSSDQHESTKPPLNNHVSSPQPSVAKSPEPLPRTNGHTDTDSSLSELSYDGEQKPTTTTENTHESGYNTECSNQQSTTLERLESSSCSSESTAQNVETTIVEETPDQQTENTPSTHDANDRIVNDSNISPVDVDKLTNESKNVDISSDPLQTDLEHAQDKPKYSVDAEEFVPRAYRQTYENQVPVANFIPVPIIGDMYAANFPNPAFLPPIIGTNFMPGFIPNQFFINREQFYVNGHHSIETTEQQKVEEPKVTNPEVSDDKNVLNPIENPVDIAKIVNKLEEAALEQNKPETTTQKPSKNLINKTEIKSPPRKLQNGFQTSPKRLPNKTEQDITASKNSTLIPNGPKVQEKQQPKEQTFSKMLKTSVSLTENKPEQIRPTYKKQTSYNSPRPSTPLKETTNTKNYSETLRKSFKKHDVHLRNPKTPEKQIKVEITKMEPKPVSADSWISVSNRKKRKNKGGVTSDTNEAFDTQNEHKEEDIEPSIEESVAQIERTYELKEKEKHTTINEPIIQEIPKIEEKVKDICEVKIEKCEVKIEVIDTVPIPTKEKKIKKTEKPKNKTNKLINKRILINDNELKINKENLKTVQTMTDTVRIEKSPEKVETIQIKEEIPVVVEEIVESVQKTESISENIEESNTEALIIQEPSVPSQAIEEKKNEKTEISKSKKKKKKPKPKVSSPTVSNDETYEFLIENTFSSPESKTNVEVSLEFDKMIQRGLYANLEEKLKTYNPSDSFIQSVNTENFSIDLGNPIDNSAFKPVDKLKNFDFSGVLFNTTMNKTFEKLIVNKNETKEPVLKKTNDFLCDKESESDQKNIETTDSLGSGQHFPITKAVKEWMHKTRENTPEVEILKSVNEIRSEYLLCQDLVESDDDLEEDLPKNVEGLPVHVKSVEDISRTRESHEKSPDLLDCWESEIEIKHYQNQTVDVQNAQMPQVQIDQCEEVLEIYDSVYGKNEDYLRICKEAQDSTKVKPRSLNLPRDGGLPNRAICCCVM